MPHSTFLEEYSLFRKFHCTVPPTVDKFAQVPIHMYCNVCKADQTFNMVNQYYEFFNIMNVSSGDRKIRLLYKCEACKKFERLFFIYVDPELKYFYKIGQYPEWEIKIEKNLEKLLDRHAPNYKKGLVCEAQGYGIGAFSYYRRITEEIIDELLDSISELIETENKKMYSAALAKTKETRVTQEKIDLVKDLLPSILRPNGINPLGVLHTELSEGLHKETDAECLETAEHIRSILEFLINQIIASRQSAKAFTESMKKLLGKKSEIG